MISLAPGLLQADSFSGSFSLNLIQDVQDMLSLDFMRYAFLSGTMLAIVSGLVGYFVVLRYQVFAVEALSHVTFTGALGVAIAGGNPLLGLFGVTILAAIGMGGLEMRSQSRSRDVAIGTLLAWVLGLGVLFLSLYATSSNGTIGVNILFGSIFGIQAQQAKLTAGLSLITIAALLAIARPLLFASVDPEVAAARGVPVRGLNVVFLILVALSVAAAIPAVGALLNSALIVTPAAIAQRLVARPFVALLLSALLALTFTWVGLALGFYAPYPIGFIISALAFVCYAGAVVWQRLAK
jgi:zinc/manganese transport system permease protein